MGEGFKKMMETGETLPAENEFATADIKLEANDKLADAPDINISFNDTDSKSE